MSLANEFSASFSRYEDIILRMNYLSDDGNPVPMTGYSIKGILLTAFDQLISEDLAEITNLTTSEIVYQIPNIVKNTLSDDTYNYGIFLDNNNGDGWYQILRGNITITTA